MSPSPGPLDRFRPRSLGRGGFFTPQVRVAFRRDKARRATMGALGPASVAPRSYHFDMPAQPRVRYTVAWLQPEAPTKPAEGAPCNGCGLCCLAEPCPLGVLVSRRRSGPCVALRWSDDDRRYWCGMVADPSGVIGTTQPWVVRCLSALARRWIASGVGCDARLEVQGQSAPPPSSPPPPA